MIARRHIAAGVSLWLAAGPAVAEDRSAAEIAAQASADLSAAAVSLREAQGRRDRVSALTETVQAYEAGLTALREGLRQSALRERSLRADLEAEDARLQRLTGVLLAMQGSPEALLLLHPAGPTETARAGMLVASVAPSLQAEVDALRGKLQELQDIALLQRDASDTLNEGLSGIQEARTVLSIAIADRTDLPRRVTEDPETMQRLINGAETLDAFAGGLAALDLPAGTDGVAPFEAAQGVLPLPVSGLVLRAFGEADAAGIERPGLVVAARPQALVTAPWPATVRYAGPLLDYGNVIILEPESGYLLVLAGLGRTYVSVGEVIDAGAPLGTMGGDAPDADRLVVEAVSGGSDRTETLYMELRREQVPQDPATWFLVDAETGQRQ